MALPILTPHPVQILSLKGQGWIYASHLGHSAQNFSLPHCQGVALSTNCDLSQEQTSPMSLMII